MPLCRYFQQGNCRYGNRCRYEHSYANYAYTGGGGGGGSGFVGGYRGGGSSGGYGGGYSYSGYGSGGGGASSGGGNERGGVSILRLKSGAQYPQSSNSLFGQNAPVNRPHMEVAQPLFGQPPPKPIMRPNTKETVQLLLNEITVCEQGKQWPLSCFCPVKELGNFPGIEDQSPEELRWYMYRALKEGKLEECKLQTAQLYDYAKLCRQQLMNPNAEILAILEKISRFERIDTSPSPFMNLRSSFGGLTAAGGTGILATPSAATSFSFKLDNKPTQPAAPSFPAFGAPVQTGLFSNPAYAGRTGSIFGGSSQMSPAAQPVSTPVPAGVSTPKVGLFGSTAAPGSIDDCVIYTPMQELSEEMVNAYKCSTFTMGSVPTKPPPKELCG